MANDEISESHRIKDATARKAGDKGEQTEDMCNPVPRLTGDRPAKPTSARSNF